MTMAIERVGTMDAMQLDQLMRVAVNQNAADAITKLAELQMKMLDRDARTAFIAAFEEFKKNVPSIVKDSAIIVKDEVRGKYAKLDKICNVLTPELLKVGITHRWATDMTPDGKTILVTCYLRHRQGHEEKGSTLGGPPDQSGSKNAIQAVGSTTAYLERYTLVASCGIAIKDQDDVDSPKKDEAGALPDDVFQELLNKILNSETREALTANYQAALKIADESKAGGAKQAFTNAKNDTWRKRGFRA